MSKNLTYGVLLSAIVLSVSCTPGQVTSPNSSASASPGSSASPSVLPSGASPSPSTSTNPNPSDGGISATHDSTIQEISCALESSTVPDVGNQLVLNFENKTSKKLKLYSLYSNRTRNFITDILPGTTFTRQNNTTNKPWLIADENEKCLKIFNGLAAGEKTITLN